MGAVRYRCSVPASGEHAKATAQAIERWFTANARVLPWRTGRTPWRAFVSELMLQQTQAARVAERFDALIADFPTPAALAQADLDQVD